MRFLRKGIPKRHERRVPIESKKRFHLPVGVFFLWFLFFAALFYIAFFSVFFLVSAPQIIGASEISEETLRGFVEKQLEGKYFNIFPKNNFFLMRPRTLETQLLEEFPLLFSANVTRAFPDGFRVTVTEREKIILWCSGEPARDDSSGQCFLADEEGKAQDGERALLPENISHTIFITDMSGKAVTLGEKVFDPDYGKFVVQLNDSFQEQLEISLEPHFTTISRFANEVRAKTSEGWEVYFGTDVPLQSSLDALKLLFAKELPKELRSKLAYIDLRTENRVYYVFREGENMENKDVVASPVSQAKASDTESNKKKKK
jgi:cell division septal protein FtsQ